MQNFQIDSPPQASQSQNDARGRPKRQAARKSLFNPATKVAKSPAKSDKSPSTRRFTKLALDDKENIDPSKSTNRIEMLEPLKIRIKLSLIGYEPKQKKELPIERAFSRLHFSAVPENMPCREEESAAIEQFIRQAAEPGSESMAMYISGVPGTGKTTTVEAVAKSLQNSGDCSKFKYITVNGMQYLNQRQVFVDIYKSLTGVKKNVSAVNARKMLDAKFAMADGKRLPVLILVDEFDQLCNKKQDIIYAILNWSSLPESRVSIIAIANTLDFPERVLTNRNASRLGSNRLIFQPYEHDQIEKIVMARLEGCDEINEKAVQLACRSVASTTGDLRKALEILRRACELAIEKGDKTVEMEHVAKVRTELQNSARVDLCKLLSRHQLALFKAAVSTIQATGSEEVMFSRLYSSYRLLCTQIESIEPINCTTIRQMMLRLCGMGFFVAGPLHGNPMNQQIKLGMDTQDAQMCIKLTENQRGKSAYELRPNASFR
ncbi:hypothetical protein WR25_00695 isoform B [Diploscapter pachys]|uniref:Origin recognition complex subunit 1 n=1 Tax=Diploscapter pachys TaxID=2018661 RepID=A0A2A2LV31_9BILA|nr:hypothetical protein WR25_00695 isoform A [Diploscapter pachys]PAV89848.1 hypothetical protein WR25_00695 isoform B [Diploscapter pachys]